MLKKIGYIFNAKQKAKLIVLSILIFMGSFLELVGVSAILPLVNVVIDPTVIQTNDIYRNVASMFHITSNKQFVFLMSMVLIIVYIVKNLYLIYVFNLQLKFTYNNQKIVATRLMNCYLRQDYLYHVQHNVAELQRNVTTDVRQFFSLIFAFMKLATESMTCLLLMIFLILIDIQTTLFLVAILGITSIIFFRVYKGLLTTTGGKARGAEANLNKWVLQSFGGIKEVKVLNRENFFLSNYEHAYKVNIDANKKFNIISALPKYIVETLCICGILITMCIRIALGVELEQFAVTLSAFAVAAMRMLPSFNRITENVSTILFSKAGTDNVFKDLKEVELIEIKENKQIKSDSKLTVNKSIEVRDLTFIYPGTEEKIFDKANLKIEKNMSIGLVGGSGSGKSTLADIIMGLLEPNEGNIFVDDKDVYYNIDAWHKTIGYIPQMIYLMDDTIRANVVFGMSEEYVDDDMVWMALQRSHLDTFVKSLKDGLDTVVGDRGVRLSGGQRQRIGIARALYTQPDVLILDEATSALDNETESAVMQSIESLHGKTTMIIIAHRLTTIQNCDAIFEVGEGRIEQKFNYETQENI